MKKWIVLIICLFASTVFAGSANFSWLPNSESDLAGYKIHYGTTANGPYPQVKDMGLPSTVEGRVHGTIDTLDEAVHYYFVCTAYDQAGNESLYSNEVNYLVPDVAPNAPTDFHLGD